MSNYEIINHGWADSQYFQGAGTAYTSFDYIATGCGDNAKEAYEDAVQNLYQIEQYEAVKALGLPKRPPGIRVRDKVPAYAEDCYWYVSIMYNV